MPGNPALSQGTDLPDAERQEARNAFLLEHLGIDLVVIRPQKTPLHRVPCAPWLVWDGPELVNLRRRVPFPRFLEGETEAV